jgi:hypothetical protein
VSLAKHNAKVANFIERKAYYCVKFAKLVSNGGDFVKIWVKWG